MEVWDFKTPPVVVDSNDNFNRKFATGSIKDDILYVFGGNPDYRWTEDTLTVPYLFGFDLINKSVSYANNELYYNSSLDAGMPIQQMSIVFGDYIYVFGGAHTGILIDVFRFGLTDTSWRPVFPALFEERAASAVVRANEELLLVIGGYNESNEPMASIEYYYPNYNYAELGPHLNFARKELMAATMDNSVYVFGGRDEKGRTVGFVEKIDIAETTAVTEPEFPASHGFCLHQNYPNPFNPKTQISLTNPKSQYLEVEIFSINGIRVKTLYCGFLSGGPHSFTWNGTDDQGFLVSSGVYIYRAKNESFSQSKRMLLLR
jgi:hypothetical protein